MYAMWGDAEYLRSLLTPTDASSSRGYALAMCPAASLLLRPKTMRSQTSLLRLTLLSCGTWLVALAQEDRLRILHPGIQFTSRSSVLLKPDSEYIMGAATGDVTPTKNIAMVRELRRLYVLLRGDQPCTG
mmetsp:Transcript_28804/g.78075  ORF Transcript_28804/g.78075 Transcript_28804/m.78075 type:complete len:130 (+) Transcript_28804:3974-4363(+)